LAIALNANYVVQQVKLPTAAMGGISFCHFSGARGQQRHRLCPEQSTGAALVVQPCVWQVKCRVCGAKPHRVLVHVLTSLASNHAGKAGSECKLHHRSRRGGACPHALPCGPVGVADWARRALGCFVPGKGRGYAQFALFDRPAQTSSRIRGFGSKSSPAAARSKPSVECRVDFCPFSFFADLLVRGAVCTP
jgi:hypothetical protein